MGRKRGGSANRSSEHGVVMAGQKADRSAWSYWSDDGILEFGHALSGGNAGTRDDSFSWWMGRVTCRCSSVGGCSLMFVLCMRPFGDNQQVLEMAGAIRFCIVTRKKRNVRCYSSVINASSSSLKCVSGWTRKSAAVLSGKQVTYLHRYRKNRAWKARGQTHAPGPPKKLNDVCRSKGGAVTS